LYSSLLTGIINADGLCENQSKKFQNFLRSVLFIKTTNITRSMFVVSAARAGENNFFKKMAKKRKAAKKAKKAKKRRR